MSLHAKNNTKNNKKTKKLSKLQFSDDNFDLVTVTKNGNCQENSEGGNNASLFQQIRL